MRTPERNLDPPESINLDEAFDELQLAKRLVKDAEAKLEVVKWGRETYYSLFGRSEQKDIDIAWQQKILERCEQIKSKKLEIYYKLEKEFEK